MSILQLAVHRGPPLAQGWEACRALPVRFCTVGPSSVSLPSLSLLQEAQLVRSSEGGQASWNSHGRENGKPFCFWQWCAGKSVLAEDSSVWERHGVQWTPSIALLSLPPSCWCQGTMLPAGDASSVCPLLAFQCAGWCTELFITLCSGRKLGCVKPTRPRSNKRK